MQDKWAKQYLLYEFYIFLLWLISFQLFVWLFQVRSEKERNMIMACCWCG